MEPGRRKKLIWLVKLLIIVYVAVGLFLFLFQESILFHPTPLPAGHRFNFNQPFSELNLPFENNNLSLIKFPVQVPRKGIVLFFHGNRQNVERYAQYPPVFTRNGYEVWMMDYPGFGKSTGKISEQVLYRQALFLYDLALKETTADRIIIYGKSMGTGIAAFLSANRPSGRLILETPYKSIAALARHFFPIYPSLLRAFSFPVEDYLQTNHAPLTIFHGTGDNLIPYSQALELSTAAKNAELVTIEKGEHNNLFSFTRYQKKMDSLLLN